jgi:hypothetical protein
MKHPIAVRRFFSRLNIFMTTTTIIIIVRVEFMCCMIVCDE